MGVYLLTLIAILVAGLPLLSNRSNRTKKIYLLITFSLMLVITVVRGVEVGTDTLKGVSIVETYVSTGFSFTDAIASEAPLYYFLTSTIGSVISPEITYRLLTGLFINAGVALLIYKSSENVVLSTWLYVVLYFFMYSFNASRQSMAIGLIAIYLYFVLRSRTLLAVSSLMAASLIHATAIIALPMLFFLKKNIKFKEVIIYTIVVVIIILFYKPIAQLLTSVVPHYQIYFDGTIQLTDMSFADRIHRLRWPVVNFILILFGVNVLYRNEKFMSTEDRRVVLVALSLMFISIVLMSMSATWDLFARLEYYYRIAFVIGIPIILKYSPKKHYLSYFLMLLYSLHLAQMLIGNVGEVLPYRFVWN